MTLSCVITMLLVMMFKLPFGFLAIFYALAIARDNPHTTIRNGFRIILANLAGTLLLLIGAILLTDYPLTRFLFVAITFFAAFFVTRVARNFSVAFGFGIMVIAGSCLIWLRPNPAELRLETMIGAAFGITLGTIVTIAVEWLLAGPGHAHPEAHHPVFVADAFSNPSHIVYALKGCLAGTLCQIIWTAVAWPGFGECVITCIIVAPAGLPGSARRRLAIRSAGVIAGGLLLGIGTERFLVPMIDSITGFTIAFAGVSALSAWFATSSPHLAYFGRQLALAYDVAVFQGFSERTPLMVSWSPQMGIFLGLAVMYVVFDIEWKLPAITARRSVTTSLLFVAAAFVAVPHLAAQAPAADIHIEKKLVLVPVSVLDWKNRPVEGLAENNFKLFDDKAEQRIETFSAGDEPATIGIVFDTSSSMQGKMRESLIAAKKFFATANPADDYFLVEFNSTAQVAVPTTTDYGRIESALSHVEAAGKTALFDGIHLALGEMRKSTKRRKALVIISDGGDNHSRLARRDIDNEIDEGGILLFAIAVYDPQNSSSLSPEEMSGPILLQQMAQETGGREFSAGYPGELDDYMLAIDRALRKIYVLGFSPACNMAAAKHHLDLRMVRTPGASPVASWRRSYDANPPQPQLLRNR